MFNVKVRYGKKCNKSNYVSTITTGLGTGTGGNGYNENGDQMAKWQNGKMRLGPGTKWQKLAGTRDHRIPAPSPHSESRFKPFCV